MTARSTMRGAGLGLLALSSSTTAMAQSSEPLPSVTERERRQAETDGIRMGSFVFRPIVALAVGYDDNVFARPNLTLGDAYLVTRAAADLRTDSSQFSIAASAYVDRETYFDITSEDATTYGAKVKLADESVADSRATLEAGYDRLAESRSSLNSARLTAKRVMYDTLYANAAASHSFGPLTAGLSGRYRTYDYNSTVVAGITVDQDFRDFAVGEAAVDLGYDLHSLTRFVVHGSIERRSYDQSLGDPQFDPATMVDRSADGYRIEAGIQREVTRLIQGTLRIGYLDYEYDDPRLSGVSGFSYHADVVWNVTPLSSLTFAADRRLDETTSPFSTGNLRDEFLFSARHELLRNLILLADGRYAHIKTLATPVSSDEFEVELGAHYYVGRFLQVELAFNHSQRDSNDPLVEFDRNVVTIGISFRR